MTIIASNKKQKRLKRRKTFLLVLGIIFICLQLLAYVGNIDEPRQTGDTAQVIGYYIGYNFALLIGALLILWSVNVGKKLKAVQREDEMNSIGSPNL